MNQAVLLAALVVGVGAAAGRQASTEQMWQTLFRSWQAAHCPQETQAQRLAEEMHLTLGPWWCVGPLRKEHCAIITKEFEHVFEPEKDVLAAGRGPVDFAKVYWAERLPGVLDTRRPWVEHPEWTDGYMHWLPRGPKPGRNETFYLCRTVKVSRPVQLEIVLRSDCEGVRVWSNAAVAGAGDGVRHGFSFYGFSRAPFFRTWRVPLEPGENRLLIKLTGMTNVKGFAFAVAGLGPESPSEPSLRAVIESVADRFTPWSEPYLSDRRRLRTQAVADRAADPPGYQNRATWQETLLATLKSAQAAGQKTVRATECDRLWTVLERDYPGSQPRREMSWERKDGIWANELSPGSPWGVPAEGRALAGRYVEAIFRVLELPQDHRAVLSPTAEAGDVALLRDLYYRARRFRDSLDCVAAFHVDVTPVPMYDPPRLRMHDLLEEGVPHTAEARTYLEALESLRREAEAALRAVRGGSPEAELRIEHATDAIDDFWRRQIRLLPEILLLERPLANVPAMKPYLSEGTLPSRIVIVDPKRPLAAPRVVLDQQDLLIFDMSISYDAKTIFFSGRRSPAPAPGNSWQIYEVGMDGSGLKQITRDASLNVSPVELPSGEVMFVSTRMGSYLQCQAGPAGLLFVMNRDGSRVRRVSNNIDSDHTPRVMSDGRILFSRWDYGIEKGVFARHALWTMNPDGTGFKLFFGNTKEDPCALWKAVPIPGRPEVVCTFGLHHNYQAGSIGLVWHRQGKEAPRGEGYRWVTRELPSHGDLTFPHGYQDPWPLSESLFLVSYGGDGGHQNRLYLLDDRGNRRCLYEHESLGCFSPLPLRPRPRDPVIPPQSDNPEFVFHEVEDANWLPDDSRTGTLVVQDVYQGVAAHLERGRVKAIQIVEQLFKTRSRTGPAAAWSISPVMSRGTYHARRLVGTVPVESDGSAHFTVPALRDVSLNLLDAEGKVLMRMGSDMQVMPGETQGCVGCHEYREQGKAPIGGRLPLALKRPPSKPVRPDWGTLGLMDFPRIVQPVLDEHCGECHRGPLPKGGLDLSGDKTRFFSMGYDNLIQRDLVDFTEMTVTEHDEGSPLSTGSLLSGLCRYLEAPKHCGRSVPLEDRQRIYTWIDANIPYYGTYLYAAGCDNIQGNRDGWDALNKDGWFQKDLAPAFRRRCFGCHQRTVTCQGWSFVETATVTSKFWPDRCLWFEQQHNFHRKDTYLVGPESRINLTHPEWSLLLTAPLAKQAGGFGFCKERSGLPIFKDSSDPDYQILLTAIRRGRDELSSRPRADMVPQPTPADLSDGQREIRPVRIHAVSSEAKPDQPAIRLVDGSGKDTLVFGGHSTAPRHSWLSAGGRDRQPYVVFDLGRRWALGHLRIWNYNEARGRSSLGAKEIRISLSTDGNAFAPAAQLTLTKAPETEDVNYSQTVGLPTTPGSVRYVRIDFLSNHAGSDSHEGPQAGKPMVVGLSEVKFYRTATPIADNG